MKKISNDGDGDGNGGGDGEEGKEGRKQKKRKNKVGWWEEDGSVVKVGRDISV